MKLDFETLRQQLRSSDLYKAALSLMDEQERERARKKVEEFLKTLVELSERNTQ